MNKFLALILAAVLTLSACGKKEEKAKANNKPTIKIGLTLPLTGNVSMVGETGKAAALMALHKWQQRDTKYEYEFVIEDDMLQLAKAANNTRKLINLDKVNAIVSLSGVTDRIIDEICDKNKIISMTCSLGKSEVPYYGINNAVQNQELANLLIERLNIIKVKKIAIVAPNTYVGISTGDYVKKVLEKNGFKVVAYEKFDRDIKDVRMSIEKMENNKPDFYLLTAMALPLIDVFVKQFDELTHKRNFTCLGAAAEISLANRHLIEGLWMIAVSPSTADFDERFTNATGLNAGACVASTYDNVDMLIWAFENAPVQIGKDRPENKDVIKTLRHIKNWQGATGKVFIDENTGLAHPKPHLQMYQNGHFIRLPSE